MGQVSSSIPTGKARDPLRIVGVVLWSLALGSYLVQEIIALPALLIGGAVAGSGLIDVLAFPFQGGMIPPFLTVSFFGAAIVWSYLVRPLLRKRAR